MGTLRSGHTAKLFASSLVADRCLLPEIERRLVEAFGPIDHRSDVLRFDGTDYYAREMGKTIDRVFFSFKDLIEAGELPTAKRRTNVLEEEYRDASTGGRRINIDPGYLEQVKVVLASTKNFYHRIYLGQGVFGEATMHYRGKAYQFFPWTYPDYKSKDCLRFFLKVRELYRLQLKQQCVTG